MRYFYVSLFHTSSPEPSKYFTLTTWGNENSPHFKCSRATSGQWPPYWMVPWSFGKESSEKVGKGAIRGRFLSLLGNSKGWVKPPLAGFRLTELCKATEGYLFPKSGERRWKKRTSLDKLPIKFLVVNYCLHGPMNLCTVPLR